MVKLAEVLNNLDIVVRFGVISSFPLESSMKGQSMYVILNLDTRGEGGVYKDNQMPLRVDSLTHCMT